MISCTCCLCWWWVLHAHGAWLVPLVSLSPIACFLAHHPGQLWPPVAAPGRNALHCSTLVGHLGMWKTIEALQWQVWWPGMAQDIRHFIAGCLPCLQLKDRTSLPPGSLAPIPLLLDHFSLGPWIWSRAYPKTKAAMLSLPALISLPSLCASHPVAWGRGCYLQSRLGSSFIKMWSGSLG